MSRLTKAIVKVLTLLLFLTSMIPVGIVGARGEETAPAPTINRLGGETRISTSTKISESAYPDGTDTVILVGATGEIDALGGTLLASKLDAPIIMTNKDRLSTSTKTEIERLKPTKIIILGGESVVSQKVVEELSGYTVERINGKNREDTVLKAAQRAMGSHIDEIFLGLGYNVYADVLAVGPATAKLSKPVFLTNKTGLSERTMNAIEEFGVKKVTIIGGETVIPVEIENTLKGMGVTVDRISGRNREETSINIAKKYFSEPSEIVVANGYVFADSVVGGYYAYKKNAPIILTRSNRLVTSTVEYLSENKKDITILGLYTAVDEAIETEIATTVDAKVEASGLLRVGIYETPYNLNPLYYSSTYEGNIVDLVFESLAVSNFEGDKYEPRIAKDWTISADGRTITFHLRKDVVFSDGTPLTAHDVVFTYKVLADPSYTGRYGSVVSGLEGYFAFASGDTEEFPGIYATDDYTVTFKFEEGYRSNFENTTMPILSRAYYGKDYSYGYTESVEAITTAPVGSGPYILEEIIENKSVSLTRNEKYTGEGYKVKDVLLQVVDQATEINQLTGNKIDLLTGIIEPDKIKKAQDGGYSVNEYPRSGYGYINYNTEAGPTAEVAVRQALTYAFDTKAFVNAYYNSHPTGLRTATTQNHPFSQVSWAINSELLNSLTDYSYDIAKAKSILDKAGWIPGKDGIRAKGGKLLELDIAAMPEHDILATLIPMWEKSWGRELGVKLNISYLEFNTILDYVIYNSDENVDKWSLFFLATSIVTTDPDSMYSEFHSNSVGSGMDNTSRYKNAEVDRLLDEARMIIDPEEAKPLYAEVVKILNKEVPKVVIYANIYRDLYNSNIRNYKTSSLYSWSKALKDVYISK